MIEREEVTEFFEEVIENIDDHIERSRSKENPEITRWWLGYVEACQSMALKGAPEYCDVFSTLLVRLWGLKR